MTSGRQGWDRFSSEQGTVAAAQQEQKIAAAGHQGQWTASALQQEQEVAAC